MSHHDSSNVHLAYAVGLMTLAVFGHLLVAAVLGGSEALGQMLLIFCGMALPYLLLAALTWVIRSVPVLIGTAAILIVSEVVVVASALISERSTSGLGLVLQPVFAVGVVVVALLVGLVLRGHAGRHASADRCARARR